MGVYVSIMCVYVFAHPHSHTHIHTCIHAYMRMLVCVCLSICMYVFVSSIYRFVCISVFSSICPPVCVIDKSYICRLTDIAPYTDLHAPPCVYTSHIPHAHIYAHVHIYISMCQHVWRRQADTGRTSAPRRAGGTTERRVPVASRGATARSGQF